MKRNPLRRAWPLLTPGLLVAMTASPAQAHSDRPLSAGISVTARSDAPDDGTLWQIPGVLMGGDAHGVESGLALDDAHLALNWQRDAQLGVRFEVSQHGSHEPAFEEAAVQLFDRVDAGILKGQFNPENATHASSRPFSEPDLLSSAFYGGHHSDTGVRLRLPESRWLAGLEFWQGNAFPATPGRGGGSQDLYLGWQERQGAWSWRLQGWALLARADDRRDTRQDDGHDHGNPVTASTIRFDGDQRQLGLYGLIAREGSADTTVSLMVNLQAVEAEGILRDDVRQADLRGRYRGMTLQPALRWGRHDWALRYSRLHLDNHLTGPAGPTLADSAGLRDRGSDPDWTGLSYRYALMEGARVRLEAIRDRTTGETVDWLAAGLTFEGSLLDQLW